MLTKDYVNLNEIDKETGKSLLHEATWNAALVDVLLKRGVGKKINEKRGEKKIVAKKKISRK